MKTRIKDFTVCHNCRGEGELFEGAWMNSNPSNYADYEEIWKPCELCNGSGATWRYIPINTYHFLAGRLKYKTMPPTEEIDIPF